jgi:hypothetical protein
MKYGNFNKAQALVEKISEYTVMLQRLESESVTVIINEREPGFRLIEIVKGYDHEFSDLAATFLNEIKGNLQVKINKLNIQLEEL